MPNWTRALMWTLIGGGAVAATAFIVPAGLAILGHGSKQAPQITITKAITATKDEDDDKVSKDEDQTSKDDEDEEQEEEEKKESESGSQGSSNQDQKKDTDSPIMSKMKKMKKNFTKIMKRKDSN